MTRKEIVDLLKIVFAAYPHTKIADPNAMVSTWEMMFGEYSAESVYKAARLHMENSKFFPTVADIKENLKKAEMIYSSPALEAPKRLKRPVMKIPDGMTEEEFLNGIIESQIALETEIEQYKYFLPYEK